MPADLVLPFLDFTNRNSKGNPYTDFPADIDTDLNALQPWANQVTSELRLLSGRASALGADSIITEANGVGRIGRHSGLITGSTTTDLTIAGGNVFTGGSAGRIPIVGATVVAGGQPSGTLVLAIDANGNMTWETLAAQQQLDLYTRVWNGTIFTADAIADAAILPDGDEQELSRTPAGGLVGDFPQVALEQFGDRITAIEDYLNRSRIATETVTALALANNSSVDLAMATETFKDGITFTATSADLTIVTAGLYLLQGFIAFDESSTTAGGGTPNAGQRQAALRNGGAQISAIKVEATSASDTKISVAVVVELAASDIIHLNGFQNSGGTSMDVHGELQIVRIAPAV